MVQWGIVCEPLRQSDCCSDSGTLVMICHVSMGWPLTSVMCLDIRLHFSAGLWNALYAVWLDVTWHFNSLNTCTHFTPITRFHSVSMIKWYVLRIQSIYCGVYVYTPYSWDDYWILVLCVVQPDYGLSAESRRHSTMKYNRLTKVNNHGRLEIASYRLIHMEISDLSHSFLYGVQRQQQSKPYLFVQSMIWHRSLLV